MDRLDNAINLNKPSWQYGCDQVMLTKIGRATHMVLDSHTLGDQEKN